MEVKFSRMLAEMRVVNGEASGLRSVRRNFCVPRGVRYVR
jgi:hypothetical protein